MKEDYAPEIIAYGRWLMAHGAGQSPGTAPAWVKQYRQALGWSRDQTPADPLQAILTLLQLDAGATPVAYLPPEPLGLDQDGNRWLHFPTTKAEAGGSRDALYRKFLAAGGAQEAGFDRFFYLMRKFATTLPNTYGEPGVSLFEQWKIVAALVAIAGSTAAPPTTLGLVKGDIPGIQRTINTISSKGAAKAMRGRSAFIQLLGDALVRRLLADLGLSLANVVYDAGGNFVLLTGWTDGDAGTAAAVRQAADAINRLLLCGTDSSYGRFDGFHGDLAVALAAQKLDGGLAALRWDQPPGKLGSLWQQAEAHLNDALTAAKNRPFGALAGEAQGFHDLFAPEPAETDEFCTVCRRLARAGEPPFEPLDRDDPEGSGRACPECRGFNELANDMGHGDRILVLSDAPLTRGRPDAWQIALHAASRRWYTLERPALLPQRELGPADRVLSLDPDGFAEPAYTGFRWLAHTTPAAADGAILANDAIADKSTGIKRLGVLRMDVDNLGDLIVRGLPARTPMQTAELSQALERFFAGWLDRICQRVDGGKRLFYVLFAGGDDLFVIGPWDLMPTLAAAIQDGFDKYANAHPGVHLSGGIAVVGEHAPMHQAADESHEALSEAKKLDCDGPAAKNALTFLGHTFHWGQFEEVVQLKDAIVALAEDAGLGNAVITRLLAIERRYRRDCGRPPYGKKGQTPSRIADPVYYGPWMWQQAYAFARFKEGRSDPVKEKLDRLQGEIMSRQILELGLAARWAQWLLRKGV